jgi:hypothetical protein
VFRPCRPSAGSRVIEKAGAGFGVGLGLLAMGLHIAQPIDPRTGKIKNQNQIEPTQLDSLIPTQLPTPTQLPQRRPSGRRAGKHVSHLYHHHHHHCTILHHKKVPQNGRNDDWIARRGGGHAASASESESPPTRVAFLIFDLISEFDKASPTRSLLDRWNHVQ